MSNYHPNDTLPSSKKQFGTSDTYTSRMYNGSYTQSDATSYGGYYNFHTTSAGTITSSKKSGDISYDICSKNWKLPSKANFSNVTDSWLSVYAGRGYGTTIDQTGSTGIWWSTSIDSSNTNRAFYLITNSSGTKKIESSGQGAYYIGISVRCLAK